MVTLIDESSATRPPLRDLLGSDVGALTDLIFQGEPLLLSDSAWFPPVALEELGDTTLVLEEPPARPRVRRRRRIRSRLRRGDPVSDALLPLLAGGGVLLLGFVFLLVS